MNIQAVASTAVTLRWRDADPARRIDERHLARAIVDEEIERIDRVDLDRELDQHVELGDRLPGLERDARDAIAVRIAQPVQAMLRLDQQLIALDPRARVIGRPQPDQLRA